jgi:hypothetical protein
MARRPRASTSPSDIRSVRPRRTLASIHRTSVGIRCRHQPVSRPDIASSASRADATVRGYAESGRCRGGFFTVNDQMTMTNDQIQKSRRPVAAFDRAHCSCVGSRHARSRIGKTPCSGDHVDDLKRATTFPYLTLANRRRCLFLCGAVLTRADFCSTRGFAGSRVGCLADSTVTLFVWYDRQH